MLDELVRPESGRRRPGSNDLVYTGPDTASGRYMRNFWQPIYEAAKLPAGHAQPVRVFGEEFTLYRGESGAAHVVAFRCSHRGTQLSTAFIEGDCLRCFYHGWKFAPTGECVERPAEKKPPTERNNIRGYPTQEYLGLIFVYLGEGAPPELPRFPLMEQEGLLEIAVDTWPVNVFFALENDWFHLAFVHRDLMAEQGLTGLPECWAEENEFGVSAYAKWPGKTSISASHRAMPNVTYNVPAVTLISKRQVHIVLTSWRVPIDDRSHHKFSVSMTPVVGEEARMLLEQRSPTFYDREIVRELGDAVLAGKLRIKDIPDRTNIEVIQDYVAQVGQGSVENRNNEQLGLSDEWVALVRKVYRREMTALANGRPLKEWRLTKEIEPTF